VNTARFVLALLSVVMVPPAIVHWLVVHSFARFWRRIGPPTSYIMLIALYIAVAAAMYAVSGPILAVEFGTNWILLGLAVVVYLASASIEVRCRRMLSARMLMGGPELNPKSGPGKLLTEGIYGRVRHPRYAAVLLGMTAVALFCNYLGLYVIVALTVPGLYVVAVLEERELLERFGTEYRDYMERVPRFVPKKQQHA
jgi:protein-S-isoprenylcysteine O-methyltransferase Ste14